MAELVVDVGMHNGNDTAYQLAVSHDVVAVKANPEFCKGCRDTLSGRNSGRSPDRA